MVSANDCGQGERDQDVVFDATIRFGFDTNFSWRRLAVVGTAFSTPYCDLSSIGIASRARNFAAIVIALYFGP